MISSLTLLIRHSYNQWYDSATSDHPKSINQYFPYSSWTFLLCSYHLMPSSVPSWLLYFCLRFTPNSLPSGVFRSTGMILFRCLLIKTITIPVYHCNMIGQESIRSSGDKTSGERKQCSFTLFQSAFNRASFGGKVKLNFWTDDHHWWLARCRIPGNGTFSKNWINPLECLPLCVCVVFVSVCGCVHAYERVRKACEIGCSKIDLFKLIHSYRGEEGWKFYSEMNPVDVMNESPSKRACLDTVGDTFLPYPFTYPVQAKSMSVFASNGFLLYYYIF